MEAEGPAEDEEMAAVPEPTVRKGPTPEQITAIKVLLSCSSGPAAQTMLQHAWPRFAEQECNQAA